MLQGGGSAYGARGWFRHQCFGDVDVLIASGRVYQNIYILKNIFERNMYIYIKYSTYENTIFLQKDAHRFTDHFASPEISVRVDFEG